jgi:hypothetical protein
MYLHTPFFCNNFTQRRRILLLSTLLDSLLQMKIILIEILTSEHQKNNVEKQILWSNKYLHTSDSTSKSSNKSTLVSPQQNVNSTDVNKIFTVMP